jgi:hypothetical protein
LASLNVSLNYSQHPEKNIKIAAGNETNKKNKHEKPLWVLDPHPGYLIPGLMFFSYPVVSPKKGFAFSSTTFLS